MSNDPPPTVWQTQEANPLSSVTSDNTHDVHDEKPDARRTSGGSRRSGRKKDETAVKAEDTADASTNGKNSKTQKEAKPRKGRPREKSTTTAMSTSRKKVKLEEPEAPANGVTTASPAPGATPAPAPPRSPQTTANFSGSAMPLDHHNSSIPPASHNNHPNPPPQPSTFSPYSRPPSSSYSLPLTYSHSHPQPQPQPPPQRTSGQNYDPIRSAFDTSSPAPAPAAASPPAHHRSPNNYRASASPAINSIIDPPAPTSQSAYDPIRVSSSHNLPSISAGSVPQRPPVSSPLPAPSPHRPISGHQQPLSFVQQSPQHSAYSYPHQLNQGPVSQQQQQPQEQKPQHEFSMPQPPQAQQQQPEQPKPEPQPVSRPPVAMDVDTDKPAQPTTKSSTSKKEKSANAASKAPSPNPPRGSKDTQMLPKGSGLISNALFGKDDSDEPSEPKETPNIILHVPLRPGDNRIINFARLAEEQYGFAALHPRLAAHRERLARVAAAGAALEKDKKGKAIEGESAEEDLSLDVDRDSEMDVDTAMGGMGSVTNTNGATEADDGRRRRKKKVEEYDRDDPFVDDSEMVWQEQAAASKDGFFVYSGPLVPEGDKVQVERADGTIKRGRGRGRGARSRGTTSTHQQPLAAAPVNRETGLPLRGPGSRGGTSRRARTTKKQNEDKPGPDRPIMKATMGRGGGSTGRGGGTSTRGAKTPSAPAELAPAPAPSSKPNLAPAYPGTNVFTSSELMMKP